MRNAFFIIVFLCGNAAAQQVYTCRDAANKKVFSDIPCGATEQRVNVRPARGSEPSSLDPNIARQLDGLRAREQARADADAQQAAIRAAQRPYDDYAKTRKAERCSNLKADLDVAESTVRNGAVHWQYNSAKARIPALQNQIAREC